MKRENSLTYEECLASIDGLVAKQQRVTNRAVLEALGKGSMGTIQEFVKKWRDSQPTPAIESFVMPPEITKAIRESLTQERATARVGLQEEVINLRETNEDLVAELKASLEGSKTLATGNSQLRDQFNAASGQVIELEKQAKSMTDAHMEYVKTTKSEIDALFKEKVELGAKVAEERWRANQNTDLIQQLTAQAKIDHEAIASANQARIDAERKLAGTSARLEIATQSLQELQKTADDVQALQIKNGSLEAQLAGAKVQASEDRKTVEFLRSLLDEQINPGHSQKLRSVAESMPKAMKFSPIV